MPSAGARACAEALQAEVEVQMGRVLPGSYVSGAFAGRSPGLVRPKPEVLLELLPRFLAELAHDLLDVIAY